MEDTSQVPAGVDNHQGIMAALPSADAQVTGVTSATAGINVALDSLLDSLLDMDGSDPSAMILITDGVANCGEGQPGADSDPHLATTVADAFTNFDIPT